MEDSSKKFFYKEKEIEKFFYKGKEIIICSNDWRYQLPKNEKYARCLVLKDYTTHANYYGKPITYLKGSTRLWEIHRAKQLEKEGIIKII